MEKLKGFEKQYQELKAQKNRRELKLINGKKVKRIVYSLLRVYQFLNQKKIPLPNLTVNDIFLVEANEVKIALPFRKFTKQKKPQEYLGL